MRLMFLLLPSSASTSLALFLNGQAVSYANQELVPPHWTRKTTEIRPRTFISSSCDRSLAPHIHMGDEVHRTVSVLSYMCYGAEEATESTNLISNSFHLGTLERYFGREINGETGNVIHRRFEKIAEELRATPQGRVLLRCDDPERRCATSFPHSPVDIYFHSDRQYINVCESFIGLPRANDEGAPDGESQLQLLFRTLSQIKIIFDGQEPLNDPEAVENLHEIWNNQRYYKFARDIFAPNRHNSYDFLWSLY